MLSFLAQVNLIFSLLLSALFDGGKCKHQGQRDLRKEQ